MSTTLAPSAVAERQLLAARDGLKIARRAQLLPALAAAVFCLCGWLTASNAPAVLGRYSTGLFAMNIGLTALLALHLWSIRRRSLALIGTAIACTALATLPLPANSAIQQSDWLMASLPFVRLICGVALVVVGFAATRMGRRPLRACMAFGAVLVTVSLVDAILLAVMAGGPDHRTYGTTYRGDVDPAAVTPDDIVIVGDSFVWGQGVGIDERFGARLDAVVPGDVLNLGIVGDAPPGYIASLKKVPTEPQVERVIVAFYTNDLELPVSFGEKLGRVLKSASAGFPTLRFISDKLERIEAPDVHAYDQRYVDGLAADTPSFDEAIRQVTPRLAELGKLAVERSSQPPILLILPMLRDFRTYPLRHVHDAVGTIAADNGFEVVDLLPAFERVLVDGLHYAVSDNDNHYNPQAHALVAQTLADYLKRQETP